MSSANIKSIFLLCLILLVSPATSACGWFTYEDIPDTRIYYDIEDNVAGVALYFSNTDDKRLEGKEVYQGPVPLGYNLTHFRLTGATVPDGRTK